MKQQNFHVETLTKEKAAELGHIAWIEESDPVIAVRKMMEALKTKPYNCAIWVDPNAKNQSWRKALEEWRENNNHVFDFTRPFYKKFSPATTSEEAQATLRLKFTRAAKNRAAAGLRKHMRGRIKAMFEVFGSAFSMEFAVRCQETWQDAEAHIDGDSKEKNWRFLEAIHGANTYLFSNKDAVKVQQKKTWVLPDEGTFTAYEVPKDCFILVANDSWLWQPIMHATPFVTKHIRPKRRTLVVYDCKPIKGS